jgi:fructose-bisphosphate aldolase class 1
MAPQFWLGRMVRLLPRAWMYGRPFRCKACYAQGERIVIWRAVMRKAESASADAAFLRSANALAREVQIAVATRLIRVFEPEVLPYGDYNIYEGTH